MRSRVPEIEQAKMNESQVCTVVTTWRYTCGPKVWSLIGPATASQRWCPVVPGGARWCPVRPVRPGVPGRAQQVVLGDPC